MADTTYEEPSPYNAHYTTTPEWSGVWKPGQADVAELRRWRRSRVGIPRRYEDATVAGFTGSPRMLEAQRKAEMYVHRFPDLVKKGVCMGFVGAMGTGKTTLACAVAGEVAEMGYTAKYAKMPEIGCLIRDSWRRDAPKSSTEIVADLIAPDLLVLDEVGVQQGSQDDVLLVHRIIDGRYEAMRPTVITSNLDMDGLTRSLGGRCLERLRENRGIFVVFDWKSFRTQE